jgi:circadian clock protein KaiC
MMRKKLDVTATGIQGFDELLDGGFVKNSIITLTGGVATGKTTFGVQFLYNGIINDDENGMLISFEEQKKTVYRNMLKMGMNLKALEDEQKLIFINYPPHEVDLFFEQEETLVNLIDKFGVSRLVIDTASSLGTFFETKEKRREGMLKLIDKLKNWKCTTILINENYENPDISKSMESLCDGVVYFYNPLVKGVRKRGIEIYEMRGSKHSMNVHPMRITSKGIEVDSNNVLPITLE